MREVAVDALSFSLGLHQTVGVDVGLVKGGDVALRQDEVFVCHIGWLNETIGNIRVDSVVCNVQLKRFVYLPGITIVTIDLDRDALALRCIAHRCPVVIVNDNLVVLAEDKRHILKGKPCNHLLHILHHEVRGAQICRQRNIGIVRINGRFGVYALSILRYIGAGTSYDKESEERMKK